MEPLTLQPGQVGTLLLQINTLSNTPGPQGWRVTLVQPEGGAELMVRAELTQEIVISPASVVLYGGRRTTQHVFQIVDRRGKPLRVLKAEGSSPLMALGPPPTLAGTPAQGEIKLSIKEGFLDGRHEERVTLTTDDPEYPKLVIPVTVIRKPSARFAATPTVLQFSREGSEPKPNKLVTIRDAKGEALKIERIEADHPAVAAELVKQEVGFATLKVTLDRSKAKETPPLARVWIQIAGQATPLSVPVQID